MEPSFYQDDIVLFIPYKHYHSGDVVIADKGGREIIKRIAHIEGTSVYLTGDNRLASTDSRSYGPVERATIKGRLWMCLPLSRFTARRR